MTKPVLAHALPSRLAILIVCLYLGACGGHHNAKENTQVAAKVGSYEITSYQVTNALAQLPSPPSSEGMPKNRQLVLENLINQELAVEQAQKQKLDRQPQILAAIEQSRRDILARAYFSQLTETQTKPSGRDIDDYYRAHPELFSARKIYTLKELRTVGSDETVSYLEGLQTSGKSLELFAQWLQDKNIPFTRGTSTREPESLPLDFLPALAGTKDGGIAFSRSGDTLYAVQIVGTHPAPVTEETASPAILRFLETKQSRAIVGRELERLRANSKIEYEGEFAKTDTASAQTSDSSASTSVR